MAEAISEPGDVLSAASLARPCPGSGARRRGGGDMGTSRLIRFGFLLALAFAIAPGTSSAQLSPLATPVRTIFLDAGSHSFSVPSTVTYNPTFDQYYASDTGFTGVP